MECSPEPKNHRATRQKNRGKAQRKERYKIKSGQRKGRSKFVGFEVLTAVVMKRFTFWDNTQISACHMLPR
jgi:hypothetical protein